MINCSHDNPDKCFECIISELKKQNEELKIEKDSWKDKYEELEINKASCCLRMEELLEEAAPDWIGDNLIDVEACLKSCYSEFAIRLLRVRRFLNEINYENI